MNFTKLLQGIIAGALFSATLSAVCDVYIAFTSNAVSDLGLGLKIFGG